MAVAGEQEPTEAPLADTRRTPLRVVAIVDNNPADCWWTRAALRPLEGCAVRVFRDAREFLAELRHGVVPDLSLVDYRMPVVDGLQVGAALAATQEHPGAQWALLTGLADDEIDTQARRLGAADVLTKPLRADDLRARVRRLLRAADLVQSPLPPDQAQRA